MYDGRGSEDCNAKTKGKERCEEGGCCRRSLLKERIVGFYFIVFGLGSGGLGVPPLI